MSWYAQHFNRRHKRYGHLFQNRYKSFLCEEDPYLLELVRYIHLNPLRAGIVKSIHELNRYALTGHAGIMGRMKRGWQNTGYVLSMFGEETGPARKAYCKFVAKGISQGRRPELVGGGLIRSMGGWVALRDMRKERGRVVSDERILGSSDFVESVLAQANEALEKRTLARARGMDLDKLIALAAERFAIEQAVIRSSVKQRAAARARAIVCFVAVGRLGIKGTEVAKEMNLTPSGVSKLAMKGRKDPLAEDLLARLFDVANS